MIRRLCATVMILLVSGSLFCGYGMTCADLPRDLNGTPVLCEGGVEEIGGLPD